jgi:hypothetical protein
MNAWSYPDHGLTDRHREAGARALKTLAGEGFEVGLAFYGGSLAVGLGHALSDLDLYVVATDGPSHALGRVLDVEGLKVQINPLPAERYSALVELATHFRLKSNDRRQVDLTDREFQELVRLTTGEPAYVADTYAAEYARISRDVVRKIMLVKSGLAVNALSEDVAGCIESGDLRTAATAATLALGHAAEGVLAAAGDIYVGPKFLHRRLQRTPATRALADVLWVMTSTVPPPGARVSDVERYAADCLYRANGLISQAMLDGWDTPLERAHLPQRAADGPRRHHLYTVLRYTDALGIAGPDIAFQVSPDMARLWLSLDGSALDCRTPGTPTAPANDADEAAVAAAVAKLIAAGVAVSGEVSETAWSAKGGTTNGA